MSNHRMAQAIPPETWTEVEGHKELFVQCHSPATEFVYVSGETIRLGWLAYPEESYWEIQVRTKGTAA